MRVLANNYESSNTC